MIVVEPRSVQKCYLVKGRILGLEKQTCLGCTNQEAEAQQDKQKGLQRLDEAIPCELYYQPLAFFFLDIKDMQRHGYGQVHFLEDNGQNIDSKSIEKAH